MGGVKPKLRVASVVTVTTMMGLLGLFGLLKPIQNGCIMTYMYPTYIPISTTTTTSSVAGDGDGINKYGLYLYHEGWKKIDVDQHLKQLNGVPVLFIPGNGGSFKQVRSLAAESDRAYQGGPLERTLYKEDLLSEEEGGFNVDGPPGFQLANQYSMRLDWFAVDLEGEHSAMDAQILEEHTEYAVYAIHRILDRYKESHDARQKEGAATSSFLPKSVILVGHSMGGFVARAAIIHPRLRKSAVETVLTLSTPHQSPPVALQPSLGHYFARVNEKWRKGYEVQTTSTGHLISNPSLSHVVVVSISGGYNDYQVRTQLEMLNDIVPPTHGFTISSTSMRNVWLSMEHQAILWCSQLVIQVSHTLLTLIDSKTGHPFPEAQKRLEVFARMLRSPIPEGLKWTRQRHSSHQSAHFPLTDGSSDCPSNIHWNEDGLERDLYIQSSTVPVLAMDGRRRWLDIQKLGSNGKKHFIFVTNLAPCYGVRLHLWPEKRKPSAKILEVTSKMMQIPSRPAPRQIEPGSQTEQAPPSSVLLLSPEDMSGFRFLTISVAPRPTISGRPPPAVSMAVGQFFNPEDGREDFSAQMMLKSTYSPKEIILKENHPLAFNFSFAVSLGLLPISLSLETTGCGITRSGLPTEGDMETSRLCKLRCFPPVALAWDPTSGLHIFRNLDSDITVVDSSPTLRSSHQGSNKTNVLLLVDPHCSYRMSVTISETAAAARFLLLYGPQIVGLSFAVTFFALMRQAHAWNFDLPIPSMLTAVESNLRILSSFLLLGFMPILVSIVISLLMSQPLPPFTSFAFISMICYVLANGVISVLILVSQMIFYLAALIHVFVKSRWLGVQGNLVFLSNISSSLFSLRVIRIIRANPSLLTASAAITIACVIHPALGLFILILFQSLCCHNAMCCSLTASFRSHTQETELCRHKDEGNGRSQKLPFKHEGGLNKSSPLEENSISSPNFSKSFGDTQLEVFHHLHGLLILCLLAALMFVPSLVAWVQRIGLGHSLPWFLDSVLSVGVILHGVCNSKPEFNSLLSFVIIFGKEVRLELLYLVAGYYSYLSGLSWAPYKVFYPIAAIGLMSFLLMLIKRRSIEKGDLRSCRKKHSHRH